MFSDISPHTAEILFEVFDRAPRGENKFLGLGIVGVEELLINPSQRQTISLQSRPYQEDSVSGTITVEVNIHSALYIIVTLEILSFRTQTTQLHFQFCVFLSTVFKKNKHH